MKQHERCPSARVVQQYDIDTLGAPFKVTLCDSVTFEIDRRTGEEKVNVPDVIGLINAVVRKRVTHPRKLNGDELKFVRNALGVKAKVLADFLDMTPEHLSRCEAGVKIMSTMSEKVFRLFAFLGTNFAEPEELLVRPLDECEIKKKAINPNCMWTGLATQFLSMKIKSAYCVNEELHFSFTWRPVEFELSEENEWTNTTECVAAYG
jgi:DNA-binding transcriptional regulator YiaG